MSFDESLNIIITLNIVFVATFWLVGLLFLYTDITGKPKCMLKYKVQPGRNQPVDKTALRNLIRQLLFNYLVVGFPYSVLHYILHKLRGSDLTYRLPSLLEFVTQICLCVLVEEITFYYSHRILHSKYFYRTVHKQHHEWTAPVALSAAYAHPIEYAFGNIVTVALGPLLLGMCHTATLGWIVLAIIGTTIHHSGYHLPYLLSPEFHDYHHLKFVGNYGLLGILDRLHGTFSPQYLNSKCYARHHIIFSASEMQ